MIRWGGTTIGPALVLSFSLTLLAFACNASQNNTPDPLLVFGAGPISEQQFREEFRSAVRQSVPTVHTLCRASNFSDQVAVLDLALELLQRGQASSQTPDSVDMERLDEVVRFECARLES